MTINKSFNKTSFNKSFNKTLFNKSFNKTQKINKKNNKKNNKKLHAGNPKTINQFCGMYKKDILGNPTKDIYELCKINKLCRKIKCQNIDKKFHNYWVMLIPNVLMIYQILKINIRNALKKILKNFIIIMKQEIYMTKFQNVIIKHVKMNMINFIIMYIKILKIKMLKIIIKILKTNQIWK